MKYFLFLLLPLALMLESCGGKKDPDPAVKPAGAAVQGNTTTIMIVPSGIAGVAGSVKVTQTPQGGPPPVANAVHIAFVSNAESMGLTLYKSADGVNFAPLGRVNDNLPVTQAATNTWYRIQSNGAPIAVNEKIFDNPPGLFSGVYSFTLPGGPPPPITRASLIVEDDFYNY